MSDEGVRSEEGQRSQPVLTFAHAACRPGCCEDEWAERTNTRLRPINPRLSTPERRA